MDNRFLGCFFWGFFCSNAFANPGGAAFSLGSLCVILVNKQFESDFSLGLFTVKYSAKSVSLTGNYLLDSSDGSQWLITELSMEDLAGPKG